jgi:hypothetical protein
MACLPWFLTLLASVAVLYLLARASRARFEWCRLLRLHADQHGSAQTLSFVLTLPIFIWVLMFIVQVSQLMIGQVVVHYAAYAAARAASVWIPADCSQYTFNSTVGQGELDGPNRVADGYDGGTATTDSTTGASGSMYTLGTTSVKYVKIRQAAVLGCMPISPSRNLGASLSGDDATVAADLIAAYNTLTQSATGVTSNAVTTRIQNKLAFADANTTVEVSFFHSDAEIPPNVGDPSPAENFMGAMGGDCYLNGGTAPCFYFNEIGWRDPITVTVKHNLALLPGPGRLLAAYLAKNDPSNFGGQKGTSNNVYTDTYTYQLSAATTIGNEGERPVVSYAY